MAVHRVGRTLLLDELDIQELFMRSSQVSVTAQMLSRFILLQAALGETVGLLMSFNRTSLIVFVFVLVDWRLDMVEGILPEAY